ncbi:MAG: nucleoside hydrolase-like domain-containing protein [Novosphingobium sp.]
MLRFLVAVLAVGSLALPEVAAAAPARAADTRSRLIVLTDIGNEPDDSESMVRLLLYSNDIDIEGLIATTSRHLPRDPRPELIEQRISAYAQVLSNLRKHDARYPDAVLLQRRLRSGSPVYGMTGVGRGKDTSASRLIIEAVDKPDPRPVWIAAWGGAADLAQALWTVRSTRSPREIARFVAKLRVYSISDQDDAGSWARAYFPNLFWVTSIHGFTRYQHGTWLGISASLPGSDSSVVSKPWLDANIRDKGSLGAMYPAPAYIMEGDTPSFLNLIPNGLSIPERPDWGGWGGRYEKVSETLGLWATSSDSVRGIDDKFYTTAQATIWRWRQAFQNDFAARIQWSVTDDFKQANHAPQPELNGSAGIMPLQINGCPGQPITLSARGSSDPDGDQLTFHWSWYREASGLFAPNVKISSNTSETISIDIGNSANVDQFTPPDEYKLHIVLAVSDSRPAPLTRYRRAIINVPGGSESGDLQTCKIKAVPPTHLPH